MSQPGERGEDLRRQSRERLRAGFLGQSVRQIREMAVLLQHGDQGVREAVAYELQRLGDTAVSFSLDPVREGALRSADAVSEGGGARALAPLAGAVRQAGATSRFPPIVIVADEPLSGRLDVEASRCCENVLAYPTLEAMREDLWCEDPQALVVPFAALSALTDEERRLPVVVYGDADDLGARRAAAAAGVTSFVPDRIDFRQLLDRIRVRTYQLRSPSPRVLLIDPDEGRRNALVQALEASGAGPRAIDGADALLQGLDDASPDLLAVLPPADALDVVRVVRTHPRFADLAVIAVAADDGTELVEAGVDATLDPALGTDAMARRLAAMVARARSRATGWDPATGLRDRPSMLRAVDRALSEARRGGRTLAVAVVEVEGLAEANRRHGRAPGDLALRLLGRCIESAVRANDVVGRLGGESILVLFPSCNADQARRRLQDIRNLFAALTARDERFAGISFSAGVSDTDDGVDRLLTRAEEMLERARARDARGAVG